MFLPSLCPSGKGAMTIKENWRKGEVIMPEADTTAPGSTGPTGLTGTTVATGATGETGTMKLKKLKIILSRLKEFAKPKAELEQWTTPGDIAGEMLFIAFEGGDISGKRVYDFGCGTGIFSIGAALLGAAKVVGVDVDGEAVKVAKENLAGFEGLEERVEFAASDLEDFTGERFDTAIQNPPFGAQKKHADRIFLEKACSHADVVYTLHQSITRSFINAFVESLGKKADMLRTFRFPLKAKFHFHEKRVMFAEVDLFRIA